MKPIVQRGLTGVCKSVGIAALGALPIVQGEISWAQTDHLPAKGRFAFHYAARLTDKEMAWLKRFDTVVTGPVLPASQTRTLKRAGSKLFLYEWLTGFYLEPNHSKARNGSWESFVRFSRPKWILNASKPHSGPDGRDRAYYYDPSHGELRARWAMRLARDLQRSSYDGVFLDLVGSASVPREILDVYNTRNPQMEYDEGLSSFLRSLKRLHPSGLIFTNQGYRVPRLYLPVADYDLSESLMTSYAWGESVEVFLEGQGLIQGQETFYRPWKEVKSILDAINADIQRYHPALKILHLNYSNPLYLPVGKVESVQGRRHPVYRKSVDRAAIYYGYAMARLWGHDSYTASPEGVRFAQDEIYFAKLGKPLGERYEERDGVVLRYYENGVVVVNPADSPVTVNLSSSWVPVNARGLWDCYADQEMNDFMATIKPTVYPASRRSYPAGRVYLYRQ